MALRRLELLEPVRYLHQEGLSVRAIASALNASPTTVTKILRIWDLNRDEGEEPQMQRVRGLDGKTRLSRRLDTSARDTQIHALRSQGKSLRAIANVVECSVGTVHRVLRL